MVPVKVKVMATRNYQSGGPSGRERGTDSITIKERVRGKGTNAVHVRCGKGDTGSLCPWLKKALTDLRKGIAARRTSDEEDRRELEAERKSKRRK